MSHTPSLGESLDSPFLLWYNTDMPKKVKKPSYDELYTYYIENGMSITDIASMYNVNRTTISKLLTKYNIPKRTMSEVKGGYKYDNNEIIRLYETGLSFQKVANIIGCSAAHVRNVITKYSKSRNIVQSHTKTKIDIPPKDTLHNLYVIERKTLKEIGDIFGVTGECISKWLRQYNIQVRTSAESRSFIESIDTNTLISSYESGLTMEQLAVMYGVSGSSVISRALNDLGIETRNPGHYTANNYIEQLVSSFLSTDGWNTNVRGIILNPSTNHPMELDFFNEKLNLAIECNGVHFHSEKYRDKNYHLMKYRLCKERGIKLLQFFGDEIIHKGEIVKSIINHHEETTQTRLFARKCKVVCIEYNTAKKFLDENHLQGGVRGNYYIALTYNDEIVCVGVFGKTTYLSGGGGDWEWKRFACKTGVVVVGGASKILHTFIRHQTFKKLITYADLCISNGDVYEKLGFICEHVDTPRYMYVINGKRYHRTNFTKQKILKRFGNRLNGFIGTEAEMMSKLGYYRIWDVGKKRYVLYP